MSLIYLLWPKVQVCPFFFVCLKRSYHGTVFLTMISLWCFGKCTHHSKGESGKQNPASHPSSPCHRRPSDRKDVFHGPSLTNDTETQVPHQASPAPSPVPPKRRPKEKHPCRHLRSVCASPICFVCYTRSSLSAILSHMSISSFQSLL